MVATRAASTKGGRASKAFASKATKVSTQADTLAATAAAQAATQAIDTKAATAAEEERFNPTEAHLAPAPSKARLTAEALALAVITAAAGALSGAHEWWWGMQSV